MKNTGKDMTASFFGGVYAHSHAAHNVCYMISLSLLAVDLGNIVTVYDARRYSNGRGRNSRRSHYATFAPTLHYRCGTLVLPSIHHFQFDLTSKFLSTQHGSSDVTNPGALSEHAAYVLERFSEDNREAIYSCICCRCPRDHKALDPIESVITLTTSYELSQSRWNFQHA